MITTVEISHPAFTMTESIRSTPTYILFGKDQFFIEERHPKGMKELLEIDSYYLANNRMTCEVPPTLLSKATLLSKQIAMALRTPTSSCVNVLMNIGS